MILGKTKQKTGLSTLFGLSGIFHSEFLATVNPSWLVLQQSMFFAALLQISSPQINKTSICCHVELGMCMTVFLDQD